MTGAADEQLRPIGEPERVLTRATAAHQAAVFYNPPDVLVRAGTFADINRQGTMTFVSLDGACYGITNQHVIGGAYARMEESHLLYVALTEQRPVPGVLVFESKPTSPDFPFDIAIFRLNERIIRAGGKVPVAIPERPVELGAQLLAVGHPGAERRDAGNGLMNQKLYHVVGSVAGASDRTIYLYDKVSSVEPDLKLGGMSGGGIYRFSTTDWSYDLVGIVFQGKGPGEPSDGDEPGLWVHVWRFPMWGKRLRTMIDRGATL